MPFEKLSEFLLFLLISPYNRERIQQKERKIQLKTNEELFEAYVKEQERYFLEYVSVHRKLEEFTRTLNTETKQFIENGNQVKKAFYRGEKEVGDGYFEVSNTVVPQFFPTQVHTIMEAQQVLINRLITYHQKLFGSFEVFSRIDLDFNHFYNGNILPTEDILLWIKEEKSGSNLQRYFSAYDFQMKGKKISFQYDAWHKDEYGSPKAYPSGDYHRFFGLLHLFECGNTAFHEHYNELIHELESSVFISRLKEPFLLENSNVFESIRFYLNGKLDISFTSNEEAEKFYAFVTTKQAVEQ